jgi:mRNA-degrading endonuclease YafQ of YafQ-DinJ toxin-antitoxin module
LFESNPKAPKLKLHALKGNLKGLHSFSVNKDVRVVLVFTDEETVTFLAIGKHDDIY